jgi:two-component system phosphate regulon response regulator PhoB
MTPRILVVESDESNALPLSNLVEADGYRVAILADDEAVAQFERSRDIDLLILNWDLPRTSHRALSQWLQMQLQMERISVLIFAQRSADGEVIRDVAVGVHEHIAQPLPFSDLFARVKALVSRSQQSKIADIVAAGELVLDRKRQMACRGHRVLNLSLAPFRILEFLMSNPGRVFTRKQLAHALWGQNTNIEERTIDVEIGRIRGAMIRGNEADPIRTVRGNGYAFDETFGFQIRTAVRAIRRRRTLPLRT